MLDYVYDIESYPNLFTCVVKHRYSGNRWIFEVGERYNNAEQFFWFIRSLQHHRCRMIGFNNVGYDYQVVHHCMLVGPQFTAAHAYEKTYQIIHGGDQFTNTVWPSDFMVQQIDLYKIHHFDNRAKSTGLKVLEFNMRSHNIGDLPVPPGQPVPFNMIDTVIRYNAHDVEETERFAAHTDEQIAFRETLSEQTGIDMLNFNDTKIGKKYFQMRLESAQPGICGTSGKPRQTHRDILHLREFIFPQVQFVTPEFNNVLHYLKHCSITETKAPDEMKNVSATLKGFRFDFGMGGIHGSVERRVVRPGAGQKLIDVDVASYYPNLAIQNRVYPQHLSELFCDIYADLYNRRKALPKKSAESNMLKLALNGVYGDSNNVYSPFYDPQYTMTITINGQLLLCMLAEAILTNTDCEIVQINTDGVTCIVPDDDRAMFDAICDWWQKFTRLDLESVEYAAMWIRDVNNYVAQGVDGKLKRIGAYAYETARENAATREVQWHKDHSALVVPKAAVAHMTTGVPVRDFILRHDDPFDFMLRYKAPGGSYLTLAGDTDIPLQRVTRYHIALDGHELFKVMPPLRGKSEPRRMAINKGWKVRVCDDMSWFHPSTLNYDWYVQEAEKLVIH